MEIEKNIRMLIIIWVTVMFIILNTKYTNISRKLDRIENNTKQIIEYLNKGDVGE
jgi:hypothetical protein